MKFDNIRTKANFAGFLFLFISLMLGSLGIWASTSYILAVKDAAVSTNIIRNIMHGDMMHDALRADAMAALLSTNADTAIYKASDIAKDTEEHSNEIKSAILNAKNATKDAKALEAFNAVDAPLNEYVNSALLISKNIESNPQLVRQTIPKFLENFEHLEEALGAMSELVEASVTQKAQNSEKIAQISMILMVIAFIVSLIITATLVILSNRDIVVPLTDLTKALSDLANGDLNVTPPHSNRGGEIGELAKVMVMFRNNAIERKELIDKDAIASLAQIRRSKEIEELTNNFANSLSENLMNLSEISQNLQANASQLGAMAAQTEASTKIALSLSNEASQNVNSIASATTQLTSTVEQIANQMMESSNIASEAFEIGKNTEESIHELGNAVGEISQVLALIENVSSQTNLLALNATIEAARAGDAGKGFAVVAAEVKELANQTAEATSDISKRIEKVLQVSNIVTENISRVTQIVEAMNNLTSEASNSVNEQSKATSLIAMSANNASDGTNKATENVFGLSASAQQAADAAHNLSNSAITMAHKTSSLKLESEEFFKKIRMA